MDDEIHYVRIAPVFVGVDHCAVGKKCPIGVSEFEGDHACRVAAQITLAFRAEFATHVAGESPFAAAEGCLIKAHISLPAYEGKLHGIQHSRFSQRR